MPLLYGTKLPGPSDILWGRKVPHAAWAIEEGHTKFAGGSDTCRFCSARKAGACQSAVEPERIRRKTSNPKERARKFAEIPVEPETSEGVSGIPDASDEPRPKPNLKLRRVRESIY